MEQKNIQKKRIKIGILIFVSFGILIGLLSLLDFDALYNKLSGPIEVQKPSYTEEDFYPADYNTDILTDPAYLQLDRVLTWSENGVIEKLYDNNYAKYEEEGVLVNDYFNALIHGDAKAYNALFSDAYKAEYGELAHFPMQRVYEMKAEVTNRETDDLGGSKVVIKLSYKIAMNDGSVRDDMLSDSNVPIDLNVYVSAQGKAQIQSITHYYGGEPLEGPSMPIALAVVLVTIPVILIAVFVIVVMKILKRKREK